MDATSSGKSSFYVSTYRDSLWSIFAKLLSNMVPFLVLCCLIKEGSPFFCVSIRVVH